MGCPWSVARLGAAGSSFALPEGYSWQKIKIGFAAWVDDLILLTKNRISAEIMLCELIEGLQKVGCALDLDNEDKCTWLQVSKTDDWPQSNVCLHVNGMVIPPKPSFLMLGSMITFDGTCEADLRHKISKAWKVWHENKEQFYTKATIVHEKYTLWKSTILPTTLWGTECWAFNDQMLRHLNFIQLSMVGMLGLVRPSGEPWVLWGKRRLRTGRNWLLRHGEPLTIFSLGITLTRAMWPDTGRKTEWVS